MQCLSEWQQAHSTRRPGQGCPAWTGGLHQLLLENLQVHGVRDCFTDCQDASWDWRPACVAVHLSCLDWMTSTKSSSLLWRASLHSPGHCSSWSEFPHNLRVSLNCLSAVTLLCHQCLG